VGARAAEDVRLQRHPSAHVLDLERDLVDAKLRDIEQDLGVTVGIVRIIVPDQLEFRALADHRRQYGQRRRAARRPRVNRTGHTLVLVRYALPFAVVLAGIVVFFLAPDSSRFEGAVAFVGAGLSILVLNLLYRAGVRGDADRDAEERARVFYDEHGHWPGEAP
jgi:hypothetical protein